MGLPLLLLKFVDEFEECTFIEGVPLSSVEEVFARFPCGDCNLPTNEIFDCPVSRGKTGELGSLSIPADGMLGARSRETSLSCDFLWGTDPKEHGLIPCHALFPLSR